MGCYSRGGVRRYSPASHFPLRFGFAACIAHVCMMISNFMFFDSCCILLSIVKFACARVCHVCMCRTLAEGVFQSSCIQIMFCVCSLEIVER